MKKRWNSNQVKDHRRGTMKHIQEDFFQIVQHPHPKYIPTFL